MREEREFSTVGVPYDESYVHKVEPQTRLWSGEASEKPRWEWVAREAKVIDVDKDLSPVRPNSPLLDVMSGKAAQANIWQSDIRRSFFFRSRS